MILKHYRSIILVGETAGKGLYKAIVQQFVVSPTIYKMVLSYPYSLI